MAYSFKKGDQSNYVITVTFDKSEKEHEKMHVLKHYQQTMNVPGFRKGHVPLAMVEQEVNPAYLDLEIEEHIINHAIQDVLKEHEEIKFIGEPYGFNKKEEGDTIIIEISLDVYPEVEVKGNAWEKEEVEAFTVKVDPKDIDNAFVQLQKNYADYQDTDTVALDTISKIALEFVDKEGNQVEKGTTYLGESEFSESDFWKKTFEGTKKDEEVEIDYNEKKLPEVLKAKAAEKVAKIKATIKDIKKQILPEFTAEKIQELFGKDSEVKDEKGLKEVIEKNLYDQNYTTSLVQAVEKYISTLREKAFSVIIPHTMLESEFASRIQSLEKRFGSKEKVKEYFQKMGEEEAKKFMEDIKSAAKDSLEKFFVLMKISDLLNLGIDWNSEESQDLMVEKKLYEHFHPSDTTEKKSTTKKTKKSSEEKEEKEEKSEWDESEKKTVKRTRKTTKKED